MGLMKYSFVRASVLSTILLFAFLMVATAQEPLASASSPEAIAAYKAYVVAKNEGDLDLAVEHAQRMLTLDEKSLGKNHSEVAMDLSLLAGLYFQQGAYTKAEPLYLRALVIREAVLGPDHLDTVVSLNNLGILYEKLGTYVKAEPLFHRALAINEAIHGPNHLDTSATLNNLAMLYETQGSYTKAEPLYLRALAIKEAALGLDHSDTATGLNNLGALYYAQGSYGKAESFYSRALAVYEATLGPNHPITGISLNNLARLYQVQGSYVEAEPLFLRALAIKEAVFGREHPGTAISLNSLAGLYFDQGAYAKAEQLNLRALAINEIALGPDHPKTGINMYDLAGVYQTQGSYAKAEPLYHRAIAIGEAAFGLDHPEVGRSLRGLAGLYRSQGSYLKAKPLYLRALAIREAALGPDHPDIATSLNDLARLYQAEGSYVKAKPLYLRALAIREAALGPEHPDIAVSLNNLASLYQAEGSYVKAEPLYHRALAIREVALGPDHSSTAISLNNLAVLYKIQGADEKAEPLLFRSLAIYEAALGPDHPLTALGYRNLGGLYRDQDRYIEAHKYLKSAALILERHVLQGSRGNSNEQAETSQELKSHAWYFYNHGISSSRLLSIEAPERNLELFAEAYSSAQYALRTTAGSALGQAAARFAAGDDALADIVRKRQDLSGEWGAVNEALTSSISSDRETRNKDQEQSYRDRLPKIDAEIDEIDTRLEAKFPEYFALTSPKPLEIEDTQELLHGNEALVMFLAGEQGTLVFAVTQDKIAWSLVDIDASALSEAVRVLRVSLENPQNAFPRGQAHGLYKKLMSTVESLVADKDHVFLVPSGALGSIPLGVLVTQKPEGDDRDPNALRQTSWWGTQQALTTLPSISSLKALRLLAQDNRGNEAFAGFGNPVLEGPDGTEKTIQVASRGTGAYFRGRYADIEAVKSLSPLPQTEVELLSLAKAMKANLKDSLWLDVRATETNVKQADLSEKRVLAFATHGLMSGEMSGLAEPALVFTPPDEATDLDDGLLTASEAALLNLNADWVILSACNTAAAAEPGADGLSGLARAFFYAGARSMLVSHWPVRDDAAARLTTQAISLQDNDPDMGRAEALRRSMVLLMNDTFDPSLAHPSAWAPFVIVGEGGSATSLRADENAILESKRRTSEKGLNLWLILSGLIITLLSLGIWIYKRREKFAN